MPKPKLHAVTIPGDKLSYYDRHVLIEYCRSSLPVAPADVRLSVTADELVALRELLRILNFEGKIKVCEGA